MNLRQLNKWWVGVEIPILQEQPKKPFRFDGCSCFFEGDWRQCCYTHDVAHWYGGSLWLKVKADFKLAVCVGNSKRVPIRHLSDLFGWEEFRFWRWKIDSPFKIHRLVMAIPRTLLGAVMFWVVLIFALPWLPFPFRWGFGYDWPKYK